MREFSKVSPTIWQSKNFKSLSAREALLFLYLSTGPLQTSGGCYCLNAHYACADLKIKFADYLAMTEKLSSLQMIRVDHETSEVMIEGWFRDNPPMNENHRKGTLKEIERINSEELRRLSLAALDHEWNKYILRQDEKQRKAAGYDASKMRSAVHQQR
jgi:hypothetical protein